MTAVAYPTLAEARTAVSAARAAGKRRSTIVGIVLAVAVVFVFCLSMSVGEFPVPLQDVPGAIFGHGDATNVFVIQHLRLPRALAAVLVGAAFGFAGAIFQSLARNPLASPDILGVTAGASVAAVFVITVTGGAATARAVAALVGATVIALTIYGLAYRAGVSSYRLVLVGIGVGAICQAVTGYLIARSSIYLVAQATVWLTGSLNSIGWKVVVPLVIAVGVLTPAVLALAAPLRALQLGDDTCKGLGLRVETLRLTLVLVAVALTGVGTAAVGPVAFVAFVAPPIARRLTKASGLTLVPAALTGALTILLADFAAEHAFSTELPVGVVTGAIGGSYLLWLIARSNRIGRAA